jgi:MFS family permease
MLATALVAAWLARRVPYKFILIGAALTSSVAYAGLALGTGLNLLLPAAFLAGAGFTVHHVVAAPFFMRNSGGRERLYLFGMSWTVEIAASVIAIAVGGWIANRLGETMGSPLLGLRFTLLGATGLLTLAVIPYSFMRRRSSHEPDPSATPRASGGASLLFKLAAPAFLVGTGAGLIIPFLNLYFRDRFALGTDRIGLLFAAGQAMTALGLLVGPVVARRIGMINTVVLAEIASIPFFIAMAFTHDLPVAALAFLFRGALMNMNHPIATNFAMEVVGPNRQALANSILTMGWNGAWMISTQVGGVLVETRGFTMPMLTSVVLYFVSSCLYLYFFRGYERTVLGSGTPTTTTPP